MVTTTTTTTTDDNDKLRAVSVSDEEWAKAVPIIKRLAAKKSAEDTKQWEQMTKLHNDSYAKAVGYHSAEELLRSDFKPKQR